MARLTKQQLDILDSLANGGYIWVAAGMPYLAKKIGDHYKSAVINRKTFTALVENGAIMQDEGNPFKWWPAA